MGVYYECDIDQLWIVNNNERDCSVMMMMMRRRRRRRRRRKIMQAWMPSGAKIPELAIRTFRRARVMCCR